MTLLYANMLCLIKPLAQKLKGAFERGEFDPSKIAEMKSSKEVRDYFAKFIGEKDAQIVNLRYEEKLLLKNTEKAEIDLMREIMGEKEFVAQKESISQKAKERAEARKDRIYDPADGERYLDEVAADAFSRKYKTEVSLEEAQILVDLGKDVKNTLEKATKKEDGNLTFENKIDRFNYGVSQVAYDNFVTKLKLKANAQRIENPLKQKAFADKVDVLLDNSRISWNFIAQNARSLVSSIDNSFFGRQGLKIALDPKYNKIWRKNFIRSIDDIVKSLKGNGDAVIDATKAEIMGRDNAINGFYKNRGGKRLDTAGVEEAFPASAPEKLGQIPIVGKFLEPFARAYKASQVAYEAGAMRMRADLADFLYKEATANKIDLKNNKIELSKINEFANSATGRGNLPIMGEGLQAGLNSAFFSVKFLKSNIDFLTAPVKYLLDTRSFARKQAALNTLRVSASITAIMAIADQLIPGSVEWDPRSSDFGKVRIGDTRFDLTGGASPVATLLARIATGSRKSSISGKVTKIGEEYGSGEVTDLIFDFLQNKLSPIAQAIKTKINNKDFQGNRPTIASLALSLTTPMVIQSTLEAKNNEQSANALLVLIADALGISANTYSQTFNWETSTSAELKAFKEKIGNDKFKEANDDFNTEYRNWFAGVVKNEKYKALSQDRKDAVLSKKKEELKDQIFRKYGFRYKKAKAQPINLNQYK